MSRYIIAKIGMLFLGVILMTTACKNNTSPKPRGYYRMEFPTDTQRIEFKQSGWPYRFRAANFSRVMILPSSEGGPYWCNIVYPKLNAIVYLSYKHISNTKGETLDDRIEETYQLSYKHAVKADYINETGYVHQNSHVYGSLYEVGGDAASAVQFYATDSVRNFIRGSLYFNCTPKRDSLAPAIEFLTKDIAGIIESIRWN